MKFIIWLLTVIRVWGNWRDSISINFTRKMPTGFINQGMMKSFNTSRIMAARKIPVIFSKAYGLVQNPQNTIASKLWYPPRQNAYWNWTWNHWLSKTANTGLSWQKSFQDYCQSKESRRCALRLRRVPKMASLVTIGRSIGNRSGFFWMRPLTPLFRIEYH